MRASLTWSLHDIIQEMIDDGVTPQEFIRESQLCWQQVLEEKLKSDVKVFATNINWE